MTQQERMAILRETGAITEGHFLITSSHRHTGRMVQLARLFEDPAKTKAILADLAAEFAGTQVDLVLGPAIGGILPAYELSSQLGAKNIFCERENGRMRLRRGYQIENGARVLIAEDVITTGGSLREVLALVRAAGGVPVGIAAIANLAASRLDFGVPLYSAVCIAPESFDEDECPYCQKGIALIRPASRSI